VKGSPSCRRDTPALAGFHPHDPADGGRAKWGCLTPLAFELYNQAGERVQAQPQPC